jgi:hypothetical protein
LERCLAASALACAAWLPTIAGGVFYNSNQSAEYIRSFDRNSAVDDADIVHYNMAGTVCLRPGLTLNLSNQTLLQWATVRTLGNPVLGDRNYESRNPVWLVPNRYAAYRRDRWALFTSLQTIGATAVRRWRDGLPSMDLAARQAAGYGGAYSQVIGADAGAVVLAAGGSPAQAQGAAAAAGLDGSWFPARSWQKGSSCMLAWRHGGAVRLGARFAVALAGRLVYARQDIQGEADGACTYDRNGHDLRNQAVVAVDLVSRAVGYSLEGCVDFFPSGDLVLSLTWEMATRLWFRTSVRDGKDGGGRFVDGRRAHLGLPQVWRAGLGWQASPRLRASLGLNAYLEHSARMDMLDDPADGIVARRDYRDTWEPSAALEWRLGPRWLASVGGAWTRIGQTRPATLDVSLPGAHADYLLLGAGFRFEPSGRLRINAGIAWSAFARSYPWADPVGDGALRARFAAAGAAIDPRKEYDKRYLILAVGVDWHLSG